MVDETVKDGGGSGGSSSVDRIESVKGNYGIKANSLEVVCMPPLPPAIPGPSIITLAATGLAIDGLVNIYGSQGVRVTAGPPMLPPVSSDSTNGAEVVVGETQNITLQRGLIPAVDQKIEMTPTGITIDGGAMPVTVQSLTKITLSVAGGLNTIELTPAGITIQGVLITVQGALVQIN